MNRRICGTVRLCAAYCLVVLSSLCTVGPAIAAEWSQSGSSVFTAAAAKKLSATEANQKRPVALQGVVTCVPEGWKGFFLEDESGGIYCEPQNSDAEKSFWPLHVGEEIQLQGVTAPGHRNSFVAVSKIVSRKSGLLPNPTLQPIRKVVSAGVDADFVRTRGHIVGLVNIAGEMEYGLLADGVEADVVHAGFRIDPKVFEHAQVEVCGIVIPQESNDRPIKIIVPDAHCFKMLATHLDVLESTPVSSIRDALASVADSSPIVRISGDIFCIDREEIWLVEGGYGIAWRPNGLMVPQETRHVELLGVVKSDGVRRWVSYGSLLSASDTPSASNFRQENSLAEFKGLVNQIVSVTATFWDSNTFNSDIVLSFDAGHTKLTCRLMDHSVVPAMPQLQRGAEYRITGLLAPVSARNMEARELLVRSLSDVVQVSGPPWPIRFTLYIVSLLSAGLTFGLITTVYCWQQASVAKRRLETTRNELRLSNESLEARVADRTSQLDRINRSLLDEANARLLVEKDQKETLACLEDAQSLAQIGSFSWNKSTNDSVWSQQCYRIHGIDPQKRPPSLAEYCRSVSEEDRVTFELYLEQAAASSEREECRYRITLPNGETRWLRSLIKSVRSEDGSLKSMEGVVQNVTDLVKAEEQLRHSMKMEVAGNLAGGIAHDLNNTLSIIQLNCYLLNAALNALNVSPEVPEHVAAIEKASEKSAMLTRQLLAFSRKQVIRPVVLNINSTIQSFSPLLSKLLEDRVAIVLQLAEPIANVRLDQGQLEQILMNLVLNARDAISGNGTIRLCTNNVSINSETDLSGWALPPKCGDYASICVKDDGSGVPPDRMQEIFEPFFSTKAPEKGTGLGLAVVHGIVRQNHGGLHVESHIGVGTAFQILIPVAREADGQLISSPGQAEELQPSSSVSTTPECNESILLVDDEPAVGRHTENVLKHLGYSVTTFTNPLDALQLVKDGAEDLQLLITDYSMPHLSGSELAKQIHELLPTLPVILMSGFLNEEAFHNLPDGMDPIFIQKPFTIQDLATAIRRAIVRTSAPN